MELWQVDGIKVWPLMRCFVSREIMKVNDGCSIHKRKTIRSFFDSVFKRVIHTVNFWRDWKKNVFPFSKIDVLFLGNNANRSFFENKWYDYILQPIMDKYLNMGSKCFYIERGLFYKFPRHNYSFLSRFFEEVAHILAQLISYFIPSKMHLPYIDDFFDDLVTLEGGINSKVTKSSIKRYVVCIKFISRFYSLILSITKPREVYISCYYSMTGMAMCYACAEKNICTVEVQHGNIYNNYAYCGWKKIPQDGYKILPKMFWFWSKDDEKEFKKKNSRDFLKIHKCFVRGMPWMYFWQSNNLIVKKYINLLKLNSNGAKLNILVTLRPNIFGGNEWNKLADLIENSRDKNICWWIRKHPTAHGSTEHSLKKICSIKKSNVQYEMASKLPLFSLLRFVDLHITTASNVAAEAKLFKVNTIFISELARLEMPFLIDRKNIIVETDIGKLEDILAAYLTSKIACEVVSEI